MEKNLPAVDLFKEFDIAKYDACKGWGAKHWLIALSMRSQLRHFLRSLKKPYSKNPLPEEIFLGERAFFREIAKERLRNPTEISASTPRASAPRVLRDFLLADVVYARGIAEKANLQDLNMQAFKGARLRDVEQAIQFAPSTVYLAIDLQAPDSVLQEEFGHWLKKARAESGGIVRYSDLSLNEQDFAKWHSQKLLPYLDLVFWAKMDGRKLTQAEIGEKLYPHLEDTSDRIRSISKNALKLISKEIVTGLARQSRSD